MRKTRPTGDPLVKWARHATLECLHRRGGLSDALAQRDCPACLHRTTCKCRTCGPRADGITGCAAGHERPAPGNACGHHVGPHDSLVDIVAALEVGGGGWKLKGRMMALGEILQGALPSPRGDELFAAKLALLFEYSVVRGWSALFVGGGRLPADWASKTDLQRVFDESSAPRALDDKDCHTCLYRGQSLVCLGGHCRPESGLACLFHVGPKNDLVDIVGALQSRTGVEKRRLALGLAGIIKRELAALCEDRLFGAKLTWLFVYSVVAGDLGRHW